MKNKKNMRRFLSGFLAMLTVLSTMLSPILSYAADVVPVPEEPPLYEAVKNELDADEVVKAKDLELETGSIFEVEKDFTGLEIPDEKKVKITFHEAKNEEKQDFTTDYEDTYKAVYYVEPVSGHPIYQINRKLIVKEAVVQVAESENQESVSNQEDENEAEGEEPAIGTAESEEPVQDEVNVEIPSEDEIYEEVTPTEIPVEEEPIDTPIPENPSEEVSTEEPAIDDNPDTDSTFEEITDTDPEEMPEATDDSFTDGTEKTEDADGNYQVNIVRGEEFHIELNHEDGQYQPGETVVFSGDMPQGSLIAVGTTKVQANQTENTEDLLYSEVTYHEESDKFSFEMPADDIDLSVSMDQAENGIMLLATDTPWDDATNIEANKYYYYSDGQLHPFDTVMGQGGNDSYKYVRYKAGGKTYYKKDELVATITTDALGYARSEDLPLGKYYVKEKETADGYVLDGEIREVDLTYRDQNTPVVTYDEDWQNNRQKAKVTVVKKEKNTDRVLEGGVFALYTKNDILNAEGEVILKADTMIEQKATDQDGRIVFTADLPINGNYYVKEVQAPAGFVTTEEIKEFDFAYAGEEVAEVSFEFTYEDEPTTFEITKSDITTGEELPGAKLKVSDSEGNVVDEWTSGSTPHIIKELEVGKKYTLTETIPADGYATAESITFVVENTADIQKVEMQDDTTKILISKVDMTDGSSEVKGAKLYILNENQEVMESWTSGDQPHYVEKLSVGTYTLLEETAPKGYIVANKVTFEVKDTGDVQGAKMEDEQAMGKVILNKTDKDTKKPMKGVEFALCDSKGKVLETLVTDSAGHAESKNYPIATFKNGQYKKAITYILKETKTLDGYQLDETEHKIQFEYVNDRTPVIEYTLDLTNKKAPEKDTPETSENQGVSTPGSHGSDATSVSNSPKTGDNTNIAIFVLALAVSAGCLGTVVTVKRKRK